MSTAAVGNYLPVVLATPLDARRHAGRATLCRCYGVAWFEKAGREVSSRHPAAGPAPHPETWRL